MDLVSGWDHRDTPHSFEALCRQKLPPRNEMRLSLEEGRHEEALEGLILDIAAIGRAPWLSFVASILG